MAILLIRVAMALLGLVLFAGAGGFVFLAFMAPVFVLGVFAVAVGMLCAVGGLLCIISASEGLY